MAKSRKQISAEARLRRKAENKKLISKYIPAEYYPLCIKMLGDEIRLIKTLAYYQTLLVSANDNLSVESSHDEDIRDSKHPDTANTAGDILAPKASDKSQDAADSKNSKVNLLSKILSEVSRRPSKGELGNQNLNESLDTKSLEESLDTTDLDKRLDTYDYAQQISTECDSQESLDTKSLEESLDTTDLDKRLDTYDYAQQISAECDSQESLDTKSLEESLDTTDLDKRLDTYDYAQQISAECDSQESLDTKSLEESLDTSLLSEGEKHLSSSFMTFESFIKSECSKDESISTRALARLAAKEGFAKWNTKTQQPGKTVGTERVQRVRNILNC